jgi:glucose/mannose transport system substrate-binding protein
MRHSMWIRLSLAIFLLAGIVLSACTPTPTPAPEPAANLIQPTDPSMGNVAGSQQVEVFSWWTGGGEAAGLDAMIKIFSQNNPNIKFVNAAVAGGAGTNARVVLATRLQANDPPDSFQGHAGQELIGTYVKAGQLESLNFLYTQNGWLGVMPKTLIPLISENGQIYSVPVNIHRANVLWYNPKILAENHLEVPQAWDDFLKTAEVLKSKGITPLALGEQWTSMQLMETILLGTLGADQYNGLWNGTTNWKSSDVTKALETYKQVLAYTNDDSAAMSWQEAARLVETDKAAFIVMGDWIDSLFKEDGFQANVDYKWVPTPGSRGVYQFLSDSFVLPKGAKHRAAAIAWLSLVGSQEGQDAFNPLKGSIPARSDPNPKLYGPYLQSAIASWKSDVIVGSLTHGVVANDTWKNAINDALSQFLTTKDVPAFQSALVAACNKSGACAQ